MPISGEACAWGAARTPVYWPDAPWLLLVLGLDPQTQCQTICWSSWHWAPSGARLYPAMCGWRLSAVMVHQWDIRYEPSHLTDALKQVCEGLKPSRPPDAEGFSRDFSETLQICSVNKEKGVFASRT